MCFTGKTPEKANADSLDDLGGNRDCQSEFVTGEAEKVGASRDASRLLDLDRNSSEEKALPDGVPGGSNSTESPFLHRKPFCVWHQTKVRRCYTGHHW